MNSENKRSNQPIWLYAILGLLAIALVFLLVRNSSLKTDKEALEAEKEMLKRSRRKRNSCKNRK